MEGTRKCEAVKASGFSLLANPLGNRLLAGIQPLLAPTAQPLFLGMLWQSAPCLWFFIDRTRLPALARFG